MIVRAIEAGERVSYDAAVSHPLQSFAWGEFRKETHTQVERIGIYDAGKLLQAFQITFHPIPHTSFTVGYLPKGTLPDEQLFSVLRGIGEKHNAVFIKLEPNIAAPVDTPNAHSEISKFLLDHGCQIGKPLFTQHTFQLSLLPTVEELLANMHQKTRYNINLSERKGVQVVEDTTKEGLQEYLTLLSETTKRQQFYAHSNAYYEQMFETLVPTGMMHIFKAVYEGKTLSVWIVFIFNKKLYYPYGASSRENREVMANNLLAWTVIKFGKDNGCESFDMWGSLGPNPDPKDPWFGFHKFKEGYGGKLVRFLGAYDLVLKPTMYKLFTRVDALRWRILRLKSML